LTKLGEELLKGTMGKKAKGELLPQRSHREGFKKHNIAKTGGLLGGKGCPTARKRKEIEKEGGFS